MYAIFLGRSCITGATTLATFQGARDLMHKIAEVATCNGFGPRHYTISRDGEPVRTFFI